MFRVSACYFAAGDCIYIPQTFGRKQEGLQADPESFRSVLSATAWEWGQRTYASLRNGSLALSGKRFPFAGDLKFKVTRPMCLVRSLGTGRFITPYLTTGEAYNGFEIYVLMWMW